MKFEYLIVLNNILLIILSFPLNRIQEKIQNFGNVATLTIKVPLSAVAKPVKTIKDVKDLLENSTIFCENQRNQSIGNNQTSCTLLAFKNITETRGKDIKNINGMQHFLEGFNDALGSVVNSTFQFLSNPVNTAKGLLQVVLHPVEGMNAIVEIIKNDSMKNGVLHTTGYAFFLTLSVLLPFVKNLNSEKAVAIEAANTIEIENLNGLNTMAYETTSFVNNLSTVQSLADMPLNLTEIL